MWLGTGDVSNNEQEKLENLTRKISKKLSHEVITSNYDVTNREQENVWRTLEALRKTTIKFPGKSDSEASILLKNVNITVFLILFTNLFFSSLNTQLDYT